MSVWPDMPDVSGVYLLSEGDEVVYVGSSVRLRTRIRGHQLRDWIRSGRFKLTLLPADASVVRDIEKVLIRIIKPPLNYCGVPSTALAKRPIKKALFLREVQ
jgi:hypothetical protein